MRIAIVGALALAFGSAAPALAWDFSVVQEDWGDTCTLVADNGRDHPTLTFIANVEAGSLLAVLIGDTEKLSNESRVVWQVGSQRRRTITVAQDEYFGDYGLVLEPADEKAILEDLTSAGRLLVTAQGGPTWEYDLQRVAKPLSAFLACMGYRKGG